jgi:hypothetical protein
MKTNTNYSVVFVDDENWVAAVEVEADDSWLAIEKAIKLIQSTERGQKLTSLVRIEVEELE